MNIQDAWEKALKNTSIVRPRVTSLNSFQTTKLPYVFLAESLVNSGDTVVRKGEISVEKPSLLLPSNMPHFEGFEFDTQMEMNEDLLQNFLLVRGVTFPSFKYNNTTGSIDVFEGGLEKAREHYGNFLQRSENVDTGLVIGTEDIWPLSVLIFVGGQVVRSANGDFKNLYDDFHRRGLMS